ncbi:hypothetical protein PRZ48_006079 [Zasmidium cellare]|uniref:Uncharacterized protein n=1 Tax=Zasmidium cellare TaxID=395010 RepID=A0ABR0EN64_ZASCE|nr:hypothetical protein PRZ48_006079 [Zasmidium cellare]
MERYQYDPGQYPHATDTLFIKDKPPGQPNDALEDWSWLDAIPSPRKQDGLDDDLQAREADTVSDVQNVEGLGDKPVSPPDDALLQDIPLLAQHVTETHSKIASVLDETMMLRAQAMFERDQFYHRRQRLSESLKALTDRLLYKDSAVSLLTRNESDIEELQQRLREDQESVEAQHQQIFRKEEELIKKEFALRDKGDAFAQVSQKLVAALRKHHIVSSELNEGSLSPPTVPRIHHAEATPLPSPVVPLPLEIYYEKMGAVGWKRDRLFELRTEYEDTRTARLFRREREETLELSEEEFEAEWSRKLSDAYQEFATAEVEVEEAKAKCIAEGLDANGHNQHRNLEITGISDFPVTPEDGPQDSQFLLGSPAPGMKSSERDQSSTLLTEMTGALNHDAAPKRRRKRETQRSRNRVKDWMQGNELTKQYTFDFEQENLELYPTSRPIAPSRRTINGSLEDMVDWPEVGSEIREKLPEQLKEHSQSEPNIFRRRGAREQIRPPRSSSESRIEEQRRRMDTHQNSELSLGFGTAKFSGVGQIVLDE